MLKVLRKFLLNLALGFAVSLTNHVYSGEINNCLIKDSEKSPVKIITNQEKSYGSYVLFNSGVIANSEDSDIDIEFNQENPYIEIEDSDLVRIKLLRGSRLSLEKRVSSKAPLLCISGSYKIFQGSRAVKNINGIITFENPTDEEPEYKKDTDETRKKLGFVGSFRHTSSPLEIIFLGSNDVFFDGRKACDYKVIFDNFNRMGIIPIDAEEGIDAYENIPIKFSNKSGNSSVSKEEVEKLIGLRINIDDYLKKGVRNLVLGRLKDYWEFTPENCKPKLKEINFPHEAKIKGIPYGGITYFSGNIFFNPYQFSYGIYRHELSHITYFSLKREFLAKIGRQNIVQRVDEHYARYFELSKNPRVYTVSNGRRGNNRYTDNGTKDFLLGNKLVIYVSGITSDFDSEWSKIAGDYGKSVRYKKEGVDVYEYLCDSQLGEEERDKLFVRYKENKYNFLGRPCFGYANPYGGINMLEDIATLTQMAASKPNHFKDSDVNYYISVYNKKLKILRREDFITEKEYGDYVKIIKASSK
ncbi:MAG: hypothetical protein Q8N99_05770 [Nanoarchaeota archaeon]|nr:hypothetical protein [Nanoarchaeota archaeon]